MDIFNSFNFINEKYFNSILYSEINIVRVIKLTVSSQNRRNFIFFIQKSS